MKVIDALKVSLLIAGLANIAFAANAATPGAPTPPAVGAPGTKMIPLKGPVKIDLSALNSLPAQPPRDALDNAYDQLRRAHDSTVTARNELVAARNACLARSFSTEDQQHAGCQATDTVATCNTKLANWCTRAASNHWRLANRSLRRAAALLQTAIDAYLQTATQLPTD